MQIPLDIHGSEIHGSEAFCGFLREQVDDLERHFPGALHRCRVAVERPHRHDRKGAGWTVKVAVHVPPHGEMASVEDGGREHTDDVFYTARKAFEALHRQLERVVGSRRDHQREGSHPQWQS